MTDIALERSLLASEGLDMRRRDQWEARQDYSSHRSCDVRARQLFLHIAVVDDPGDLVGTEDQVARNIEAIGQSRFGSGISYNALAFNSGRLYEGQPLTRRGAHTVNTFRRQSCPAHGGSLLAPDTSSGFNNNITARALVLPQQVDDPVTDEQLDAAARWAAALRRSGLATQDARWHGHRCVTAKSCPGPIAYDRIPELQDLTDHYTQNGLTDMITAEDRAAIVKDFLNAPTGADGQTVRQALRQGSKAAGVADQVASRVAKLLLEDDADDPAAARTFDAAQIRDAVKQALREGTGDED